MKVRSREKNPRGGSLRAAVWLRLLCAAVALGLSGACSREHYKASADRETYGILAEKWQDSFGQMANYRINDTEPNAAEVEAMVPPSRTISLAKAVEIATKHSREYQTQKESLYRSALSLTLTRYQYAPIWFGTVDAAYTKTTSGEDITTGGSVGVNQTFLWANGLRLTGGLALDWLRLLTGTPETSLGTVLSSTLTAPLLGRGAGVVAWENLTQAERNVLYSIRSFNRYRKTFVVSIISDYYRVLEQRDSVAIQEASYQRLVDSTSQLRMEVEVGQRPAYDLGEAEQQMLSAEQNLVSVRQRYEQALDSFKIRLALPTDADVELDPNELQALADLGVSLPGYTAQEAIDMALSRRLDLANTRDQVDDTRRKLELAAKGLGVQLDFTASTSVPWDRVHQPGGAQIGFRDGTYTLGLDADLPLDRKAERNDYREALIAMQQDLRNYGEDVDRIKLDVRQAYRDLAETAESYRIQQIGMDLAQKRVEVEKLSLQYGRGTVRLLLQSEDDLVRAQNAVLGALVDHTIAKMTFFRDIGLMQVRPDGMWEQPAK